MTGLALMPDGRLDAALLDEPRLARVLDVLNPPGEETRLVGGAVRNALLGLPPGDLDCTTTLRPEETVACAKRAGLRTIPTGFEHGTITILSGGLPIEVTTLREDVETDGRHAVVRFGRDFVADARRRDFTINALSLGRDGRIFDYTDGVADLCSSRVRFIGEPAARIREDYLRILRFFRFHATYGAGHLDRDGLAAAERERDGIRRLSRERVRAELLKTLAAPGAAAVIVAMASSGILEIVLGGSGSPERLSRLLALDGAGHDGLLGLAAIALEREDDADMLQDRLRLSNSERDRLAAAVAAFDRLPATGVPPGDEELRRLLFFHGAGASADALRLAYARGPGDASPVAWRDSLMRLATLTRPELPISGRDVLARGLRGPAVGLALQRFARAWSAAGFPEDAEGLAALLDDAVGSPQSTS